MHRKGEKKDEPDQQTVFVDRTGNRPVFKTEKRNQSVKDVVEQAHAKGIKDSLVLVDSLAFIVNVPSKTVVTAMDQTETQSNIFTNIDGAVIM